MAVPQALPSGLYPLSAPLPFFKQDLQGENVALAQVEEEKTKDFPKSLMCFQIKIFSNSCLFALGIEHWVKKKLGFYSSGRKVGFI